MSTSSQNESVLFHLMKTLHRKTHFQRSDQEVKDIETSVKEVLKKLVKTFLSSGEEYDVSDIIHVGSTFEGSKIMSPDEYDFMMVLQNLSGPDK